MFVQRRNKNQWESVIDFYNLSSKIKNHLRKQVFRFNKKYKMVSNGFQINEPLQNQNRGAPDPCMAVWHCMAAYRLQQLYWTLIAVEGFV